MSTKIFLVAMIAVVLAVGVARSAIALTTNEQLQAQVTELLAKVEELKRQLATLRGEGSGTSGVSVSAIMPVPAYRHRICLLPMRTLAQGQSGDEVRALQEFLQFENTFTVAPTGYFGPLTREALKTWQIRQGIEPAGIAGPRTAARVRILCGEPGIPGQSFSASPTRGNAPLTVVFDTWLSGFRVQNISYTIDFGDGESERAADCLAPADACISPGQNKHTYVTNGIYTATLNKITDPCPDDGDPTTPRCLAVIQNEVVGKIQIYVGPTATACTLEYAPVCGRPSGCANTCAPGKACPAICQLHEPKTYGNRCQHDAAHAEFLHEGECMSTSGSIR